MLYIFAFLLLIIVMLFSLSSFSQSYASAQQTQAAIEASRAAQIAGAGNLVVIVVGGLVVVVLLVAMVVIAWLFLRAKTRAEQGRWVSGPNARWQKLAQPQPASDPSTSMALLAMLLYQEIQRKKAEPLPLPNAEQTWLNEPADDAQALPDDIWNL